MSLSGGGANAGVLPRSHSSDSSASKGDAGILVMHVLSGDSYPNGSIFREIPLEARIVIEQVGKPWYGLLRTAARQRETSTRNDQGDLLR